MLDGLLNRLRCLSHNIRENNEFRMSYGRGVFRVRFPDGLELAYHQNPFWDLAVSLRGYLAQGPLQPGQVVVDAGAFVGVFTVLAAKMVGPDGRVIAFEPDAGNFQLLRQNIAINGLTNVKAVPKGLWDRAANLRFVASGGPVSSLVECSQDSGPGRLVEVPVVRLDDEMQSLGVQAVDFVKIDVEGAELGVLAGSERILTSTHRPRWAIASYHIVNGQPTAGELERILRGYGYEVTTGFPEHSTTWARPAPDDGIKQD